MVKKTLPSNRGLLSDTIFFPASQADDATRYVPGTVLAPIHISGDDPNRGYLHTRRDAPSEFQVLREPLPHSGHSQIEEFWRNQYPAKKPEEVVGVVRKCLAVAERLFAEGINNSGERILTEGFDLMKSMLADRRIEDPHIKEYLQSLIVAGKDGAPGLLKLSKGLNKGNIPTYSEFKMLMHYDKPDFAETEQLTHQP